jgi:L-aspartate oxidase
VHPDAELAPRDVVARAIHAEIAAGRGAYLDCRQAIGARFASRFPTVYQSCLDGGIDPLIMPIPMAPAEHYHMGGVFTDASGRTSVPGLWACGEVASTGVHGANRLASNSLLEAVVFATRVAEDIAGLDTGAPQPIGQDNVTSSLQPAGPGDADIVAALRKLMAEHVGVIRDASGLSDALAGIANLERLARSAMVQNMLLVARLITTAALNRTESRGGHYRRDFPEADPAQAHRSFMALTSGPDRLLTEPARKAALA